MSFYKSIAPYYHFIFKTSQAQLDFIKEAIPDKEGSIVEIGCGIGTLSLELAQQYKQIISVDLDAEMIAMAISNAKNTSANLQFLHLNMMELDNSFKEKSLDGIVCFGNTLVHLHSLKQVSDFLKKTRKVLKPDGKLLVQIVNYDRILIHQITQLPLIENEEIKFERFYSFRLLSKLIDFYTTLTIKSSGKQIKNRIALLPILYAEIKRLLIANGYTNGRFYGNFNRETFTNESPALIVEAW